MNNKTITYHDLMFKVKYANELTLLKKKTLP